jgi:WW domain
MVTPKDKESAYTAFNAVDGLVSKPVLGSDGAAAWQQFRSTNNLKSSKNVAPTAPLKAVDRAAGFTSWKEERANEQSIRQSSGAAALQAGYTDFAQKNDCGQLSKKERLRIEQRLIGEDQEYFIPAKTFEGWKLDYVYTTKETHGTGYYYDGMDSLKKLQSGEGSIAAKDAIASVTATKEQQDTAAVEAGDSKKKDTENPPKAKKRKKQRAPPVIVHDPNNPLEQVARRLAERHGQLPPGWETATDTSSQKSYYYNRATGERTWEKPSVWKTAHDSASNKNYYYNTVTGETVWEKPSDLA